jgi:hypothetical protein
MKTAVYFIFKARCATSLEDQSRVSSIVTLFIVQGLTHPFSSSVSSYMLIAILEFLLSHMQKVVLSLVSTIFLALVLNYFIYSF